MAFAETGYQVAELLYQTYTAVETQVRRQAEEQLQLLAAAPKEYALTLIGIIASENQVLTADLKKSAAHQLKKTLISSCSTGSITLDDRLDFAKALLKVMALGLLPRSVVDILGMCLDPVLDANHHDPEAHTCLAVQKMLVSAMAACDGMEYVGLLKAVKAMFTGVNHLKRASEFYEEINPLLLALCRKALDSYRAYVPLTEPLLEWSETLNAIIQFFDINNSNYLKTISADFQLADAFAQVILAGSQGAGKGGLIWVDAGEAANARNFSKYEILSAMTTIMLFLTDNKKKMNEESGNFGKIMSVIGVSVVPSPFVNAALQLAEEILISAAQVCNLPALHNALAIPSVRKTLTQTLNFLHKCVGETPFYSTFSSAYKAIIVGITLPLIQCSPSEFDLINSDPEEFHSLAMDICERQDIDNLKTSASQLLESVADNVDGALSFTVYFLGQLVEYTVGGSKGVENYTALIEMHEYPLIVESREDLRMELALMGFCVLSYAVQKRADLKLVLHNLLEAHFDTLASAQFVIVHARLCLLIYFQFDTLFTTAGMLETAVMYLLRCMGTRGTPKVVHLPACLALSLVLTDYEDDDRIQKYIPMIISTMVSILPYQTNKDFFESLQTVIVTNISLIVNGLSPLLSGLVHKIRSETEEAARLHDKKKSHSLIVTKCWNIVRAVLDSIHLTQDHLRIAEQLITPLFDCICEPEKIDFEDDILVASASLVKRNKAVSQLCWQVFERLPLVQQKYKGEMRYIFSFLNTVIAYGKAELIAKPAYLAQIIEMCQTSISVQYPGRVNESGCSQGAVLMQQLLMTCVGEIDGAVRGMMEGVLRRYAQGCSQTFFKIRLLDTIFAAVNYNPNLALSILRSLDAQGVSQLLSELLFLQDSFFHSYDKKLATIFLSQLFCLNPIPAEVSVVFPSLLEAAIRIISVTKPPVPKEPTPSESLIDGFLDSEDDDLPLETESQARGEEAEAALMVTGMITQLQEFDETELFRNALNCLYQKEQKTTQAVLAKMSSEKKKVLADLLQSRRVPVRSNTSDSTALRKIVKARRRLQK